MASSSSAKQQEGGMLTKGPVVIFPAQFGIATDYDEVSWLVPTACSLLPPSSSSPPPSTTN